MTLLTLHLVLYLRDGVGSEQFSEQHLGREREGVGAGVCGHTAPVVGPIPKNYFQNG